MGQEEAALPPAAVAFPWEHDQGVEARGMPMPGSPRKATMFLSWEHDPATTKPVSMPAVKQRKAPAPERRLSVPPPPGRPASRGVLVCIHVHYEYEMCVGKSVAYIKSEPFT